MEARNELIRLLKEDCNGGGRHERLFFEVARKTATFADFCRAFHAHSLVESSWPSLYGSSEPDHLVDLFYSFLHHEHSVVVLPKLVDVRRLPLLLIQHSLQRQTNQHIIWVTTEPRVSKVSAELHKIATRLHASVLLWTECIDGSLELGESSTPSVVVATVAQCLKMLTTGAPLSRIGLVLLDDAQHLLSKAETETSKEMGEICRRIRNELAHARPKMALFCSELDPRADLSYMTLEFQKHVPEIHIAQMNAKTFNQVVKLLVTDLQAYLIEFAIPASFAEEMYHILARALPKLLTLYMEESLRGVKKNYFHSAIAKESAGTFQDENELRAEFYDPFLPYHTGKSSFLTDLGSVDPDFWTQVRKLKSLWEKKTRPRIVLDVVLDVCSAFAVLSDVGIAGDHGVLGWLKKPLNKSLKGLEVKTSEPCLVGLRECLSTLKADLEAYKSKYIGDKADATLRDQVQHYRGRIATVLSFLKSYEGKNPRVVVHTATSASAEMILEYFEAEEGLEHVFRLGDAADDSPILADFFSDEMEHPAVLISTPEHTTSLKDSLHAYLRAPNPSAKHARYVPQAHFGPYREHLDSAQSAPASHANFADDFCQNAVTIFYLDMPSATRVLEKMKSTTPGVVVVPLRMPQSDSALAILESSVCPLPDLEKYVVRKTDIVAEQRELIDNMKTAAKLPRYKPGATMAEVKALVTPPSAPNGSSDSPASIFYSMNGGYSHAEHLMPSNKVNGLGLDPKTLSEHAAPLLPANKAHATSQLAEVDRSPHPNTSFEFGRSSILTDLSIATDEASLVSTSDSQHSSLLTAEQEADGSRTDILAADPTQLNAAQIATESIEPIMTPYQKTMNQQRSFLRNLLDDDSADGHASMPNGESERLISPFASLPSSLTHGVHAATSQQTSQQHLPSAVQPPVQQPPGGTRTSPEATGNSFAKSAHSSTAPSPAIPHNPFTIAPPALPHSMATSGTQKTVSPSAFQPQAALSQLGLPPGLALPPVAAPEPAPSKVSWGNHVHPSAVEGLASFSDPDDEIVSNASASSGTSSMHAPLSGTSSYSSANSARSYGSFSQLHDTSINAMSGVQQPTTTSLQSLLQGSSNLTLNRGLSMPTAGNSPASRDLVTPPGIAIPPQSIVPPPAMVEHRHHEPSGRDRPSETNSDPISLLHIHFSRLGTPDPEYEETMCGGVDHARQYMSTCTLATGETFNGWGTRKKDAKKAAAAYALEYVTGVKASTYFTSAAVAHTHRPGPQGQSFHQLPGQSAPPPIVPFPTPTVAPPPTRTPSIAAALKYSSTPPTATAKAAPSSFEYVPTWMLPTTPVTAPHADASASASVHANPIGAVNEYHQKRGLKMPTYVDAGRTSGPDHEPNFLCYCTLWDGRRYDARGSSKKDAKTNVALLVAGDLGLTSS